MDPVRNPFAPGAGSRPPELAGREEIISDARIALQRAMIGNFTKSQILLGLRGTGKTVLLNEIERISDEIGHVTSYIEAPEDKNLASLLLPKAQQTLRRLSNVQAAKHAAIKALRALRSFASTFQISTGDFDVSIKPLTGTADSGDLELDLVDLFIEIGNTASAANKGWTLLIDEVQYLKEKDLSALIVAIHRASQRSLPIVVVAAGLPQIAKLAGDAKSYAERLFAFPQVGPLAYSSAVDAIRKPIENVGESITDEAINSIYKKTEGYPFFLQEWGFHAWSLSSSSPIDVGDVDKASIHALRRLDEGFFKVRLDRLTNAELDYVRAMASLGSGPYKSSDVASKLGKEPNSLGPRRASTINKGMIYSPNYGEIAFTVPMFDDFIRRKYNTVGQPSLFG